MNGSEPKWLALIHPRCSQACLDDVCEAVRRHHPDMVVVPEAGYLRLELPDEQQSTERQQQASWESVLLSA